MGRYSVECRPRKHRGDAKHYGPIPICQLSVQHTLVVLTEPLFSILLDWRYFQQQLEVHPLAAMVCLLRRRDNPILAVGVVFEVHAAFVILKGYPYIS